MLSFSSNSTTKFLIQAILVFLILSCNNKPNIKEDLKNNLSKVINIEMFNSDSVLHGNDVIPFTKFRNEHKYLSIIYLEDGCNPCYLKFIEWHKNMMELATRNYAALFIINNFNYEEFISKVNEYEIIEDRSYIIFDQNQSFLLNNNEIPKWIVNSSILIDSNNQILMIGEPWSTADMLELFNSIISKSSN